MKIIKADGYNRDHISDELIAENVPRYWAEKIVEWMNTTCDESVWYKVVSDEYVLYVFTP